MLIDPFTVIAQIINFVILAVVLKHFLYDRVVEAMDRREASIAQRLSDAARREGEARREAQTLHDERTRLDHDRHDLLEQARHDAEEHRQELLEEARGHVEEERRRWHRGLLAERDQLRHDLQRRTAHEVFELSRLALSDLARARLEAHVIERALEQLELDDETRANILADSDVPLTVRTAFPLPHPERDELVDRLRQMGLAPERRVRFDHDPDLVLGIELRNDGTAVAWNADDYLDRMATSLDGLTATVWGDDDD
jgi:F-type H+-transporting ATPase subunit b